MKTLVVNKITRSIDLMDEFETGDYDYLELQHWFWVMDLKDRNWSFDDTTGRYYVSLMVAKKSDKGIYCEYEPTMTELRGMQHHGIALDEKYEDGSMDQIIRDACKVWKANEFIALSKVICLRAQTSWNRMDYGCEWLGGGDWEEKTLYGETTDFYITGIILREPPKSIEQEAREILADLKKRRNENKEIVIKAMNGFKHVDQPVIHRDYGRGVIIEVSENKMRCKFDNKIALFIYPDSILQGYLRIPDHDEVIIDVKKKWNDTKKLEKLIRTFECATGDLLATLYATIDYKKKNNLSRASTDF